MPTAFSPTVAATDRPTLGRRSLLAGLAALPVVFAGCGREAAGPQAASGSAPAGFRYTDARGKVIDLASTPTVVVAQSSAAAALWDAGYQVEGAYGELKTTGGKLDFQAGNLDLGRLSVIGSTYGEFDVEKYAALGPQLLIDLSFDDKTLWYVDTKVEAKITALAPTLGMHMLGRGLVEVIEAFTALAQQLGASPDASTAAKTAFETESAGLKTALAAFAGKTVMPVSRDATKVYVGNPDQNPDLSYLKSLGVTFVPYQGKATDYFQEISYEELSSYSGDVIIDDVRGRSVNQAADDQPTWKAMPAVTAGKVFDWKPAAPYSYAAYVEILKGLRPAFD